MQTSDFISFLMTGLQVEFVFTVNTFTVRCYKRSHG